MFSLLHIKYTAAFVYFFCRSYLNLNRAGMGMLCYLLAAFHSFSICIFFAEEALFLLMSFFFVQHHNEQIISAQVLSVRLQQVHCSDLIYQSAFFNNMVAYTKHKTSIINLYTYYSLQQLHVYNDSMPYQYFIRSFYLHSSH